MKALNGFLVIQRHTILKVYNVWKLHMGTVISW